jgi:predicted phage baseplate assembly protein
MADAVISAGQTPARVTVLAEHSRPHQQLTDARGLKGLEILLDRTPYLDGSAVVTTATGAFTEVDSFLDSGPNDRHFLVRVDQNDRATLRFGDGRNGLPPSGTVTVRYKTGGGTSGNVDAGRLVVVEGAFSDAHGRPVQVAATNAAPATGGTDRQTAASAKLLAPESLRVLTRSVAREDFEINARRLPAVARALMLTANEDPSIDENAGALYVIPQGGGAPTPALKNLVRQQVTEVYPCTLTFQLSVLDPVYRRLDIKARVFLRAGVSGTTVRARILQNLTTYFRVSEPDGTPNPRVDFGFNLKNADGFPVGEIAWSDVFNVIRDTEGVRKIGDSPGDLTLNGLPADVRLRVQEFPTLGTVTLVNGDTGGAL